MALADHTKNCYGPNRLGDLTFVFVTLIAGSGQAALDATRSSPGVTVATPGAGVYSISFSSNAKVTVFQSEAVNTTGADKVDITAMAFSAGTLSATATKNDNTNLTGSEEMHLVFASMASP